MKKMLQLFIVMITIGGSIMSCGKEDGPDIDKENQIVARIDGRDTVFAIKQVTLQSFTSYKLLSVITNLSVKAIDFYIIAPEITAKEYHFSNYFADVHPIEFSYGWFRLLEPNSVYTNKAYHSQTSSAEYKMVITEITGTTVKGSFKFLGTNQLEPTSKTVLVEGTFTTNLLEID